MTEARTMGQLQEEILSTVRKSEAAVIEAIETWTAKVRSIRPGRLEKGMPFTSRLPDPHELIASA